MQAGSRKNAEIREGNMQASPGTERGHHSMMWLLIAVLAIVVMVLAMWGHLGQNATSTVNPHKTPPSHGNQ